ncbi:hypothetical protein VTI28DRAFT_8461 [Corynascus sepedonium]
MVSPHRIARFQSRKDEQLSDPSCTRLAHHKIVGLDGKGTDPTALIRPNIREPHHRYWLRACSAFKPGNDRLAPRLSGGHLCSICLTPCFGVQSSAVSETCACFSLASRLGVKTRVAVCDDRFLSPTSRGASWIWLGAVEGHTNFVSVCGAVQAQGRW